ncbi:MAG: DNA polymerase [Phycisphaerae bacterium]
MVLNVLFLDMNAYFASAEQHMRPELRGRPVAVIPMMTDSTCCIAVSYEARPFGVKTGTGVGEARRMCPGLVLVPARPEVYIHLHHRIVATVERCIHVDAVHSIDELSCRLLGSQCRPDDALALARTIKQTFRDEFGTALRCSVGLAPNRFLAKVAAEMQKPDGLVVLRPEDLPHKLYSLELIDLPGIGRRMRLRLQRRGIQTVEQLCGLSEDQLREIWNGVVGRRWWHWLRGHELIASPARRRSVGHSRVLPPRQRTDAGARGVLVHLIHKAAVRLRRIDYWAVHMHLSITYSRESSWSVRLPLGLCQDTVTMLEAFARAWADRPVGKRPLMVGITLVDLVAASYAPLPLFPEERRRLRLARAMDAVNERYGPLTLYFAGMHTARASVPTRIPFTIIPETRAHEEIRATPV